ncbi:MAG: metallophosphoesterase [Myxococcaceae bacterium]|nr:metallophosphoesterase [Myxococcaceae bacterium]
MSDKRFAAAQARAREDATHFIPRAADRVPRPYRVAIGDPQASLAQFLRVLDLNGLLGDDGRLLPDVYLVSLGDHFDWGRPEDRAVATADGACILAWLAAHPPDQVQIVVGNHDLARVRELSGFSNAQYADAQARADAALDDAKAAASFQSRYPTLASPAVISRDYSCFDERQRALMTRLLVSKRVRLAVAPSPGMLLVHAGITNEDLELLRPSPTNDAVEIANALNAFFDARVARWKGEGPLDLSPLDVPGSAAHGEARGILVHRPTNPQVGKIDPKERRRYDPRSLPPDIMQVIGHINDAKCRKAFGNWVERKPAEPGVLRGLHIELSPKYHPGCDDADRLVFTDGSMNTVGPFEYELFDLDTRQAATPRKQA